MNHRLSIGFSSSAKALAFALALQMAASGQTLPTSLKIVAMEGDGATGPVRQRPSQVPVIRVIDENEKPVSGAAVVFTLPTEGATGEFPGGGKTAMVVTDVEGKATASGLRFNQIPGKVPINVNVSYKGLTARSNITQVSTAPAGYKPSTGNSHTGRLVLILAIVGAAGAGGALAATRGKSSTPSAAIPPGPTPIGITVGTPSLAPPH